MLGQSLARDFDFAFEHKDLERVWEEFPGPEGIFLKRGKAIDIQGSSRFPFVRWVKLEDPQRDTRLYFSKSFIYPLVAAPFIFLFGTNGFLVLHALLLSLDFLVAYLFLHARTKSNWRALPLAAVFLAASVVPVYFVWLMPELFNFSLALYALFFWSYKEVAGGGTERSDYMAAALLGVLTFSKPTHAILLFPIVALALTRGAMAAGGRGPSWSGRSSPASCLPPTRRLPASSTIRAAIERPSITPPAFRSRTPGRRSTTAALCAAGKT